MKVWRLGFSILLAIPVFSTNEARAQTNPPANDTLTSYQSHSEMVSGQVVKVYSVAEGDFRSRAYAVRWKGQDVVVSDWTLSSDYKEGETIPFSATDMVSWPGKKTTYGVLNFGVSRPASARPLSAAGPTNQPPDMQKLRAAASALTGKVSKAEIEKVAASTETVDAPVIKTYATNDGNSRFRAYVVNWDGQDVVVDDPLAKTDFHEDDVITFLVMHFPKLDGAPSPMLRFQILPPLEIHVPSPLPLPITPHQMPDPGKMTSAILNHLNESWQKKDLKQLKQRIELQLSATPNFVPALLAKVVYTSLIEGNQQESTNLLGKVNELTKFQVSKSYAKFRDALGHTEKSVAGLSDQESRSQALFMIFRDRFPLAKTINNIGIETSVPQTAPRPANP